MIGKKFTPKIQKAGRKIDLRPKKEGGNKDGRYNDSRYQKARKEQLASFPFCQVRKRCGGVKATQAYHVKPVTGPNDPNLWNPRNLLSSCAACNIAEQWERRKKARRKDDSDHERDRR